MPNRLLLYLSRNRAARRFMETSSFAARLTSRFVSGNRLEDGLAVCRQLAKSGMLTALDHLGENVTSLADATQSKNAYLEALSALKEIGVGATVSLKLTQFGLDISDEACRGNVAEVVRFAAETGTRIEVDMESNEYTARTLETIAALHAMYPGKIRAVIQAYLYRSEADIVRLNELGVPVRLCKGAYIEPSGIAIPAKRDVDANYVKLACILLSDGVYPALATHDEKMTGQALDFVRKRGIGVEQFEFQMLYGVRRDLQRRLADEGYRVRLYVPYGDAWYPYFMRRLAERPANVLFLLRNLFRG